MTFTASSFTRLDRVNGITQMHLPERNFQEDSHSSGGSETTTAIFEINVDDGNEDSYHLITQLLT